MHDPIRTINFSTIPLHPLRPTMRLENEPRFATHLSLPSRSTIRFDSRPVAPSSLAVNSFDLRASSSRGANPLVVEPLIKPSIGRASPNPRIRSKTHIPRKAIISPPSHSDPSPRVPVRAGRTPCCIGAGNRQRHSFSVGLSCHSCLVST